MLPPYRLFQRGQDLFVFFEQWVRVAGGYFLWFLVLIRLLAALLLYI